MLNLLLKYCIWYITKRRALTINKNKATSIEKSDFPIHNSSFWNPPPGFSATLWSCGMPHWAALAAPATRISIFLAHFFQEKICSYEDITTKYILYIHGKLKSPRISGFLWVYHGNITWYSAAWWYGIFRICQYGWSFREISAPWDSSDRGPVWGYAGS